MTIAELLAKPTALENTDVFEIQSGDTSYKVDSATLASALALLGAYATKTNGALPVGQGGIGTNAAGVTALSNIGLKILSENTTFTNGEATKTFSSNVWVIGVLPVSGNAFAVMRRSGNTGYTVKCVTNTAYSGTTTITYFYIQM